MGPRLRGDDSFVGAPLAPPSNVSRPHIAEQKSRDLPLLDFLAAFGDPVAAVVAVDVQRLVY